MRSLQRYVFSVVLVVAGVLAVDELGDLFQYRPDHADPDSESDVVLDVEANGYRFSLDDGAAQLVAACSSTTSSRVVGDVEHHGEVGAGRYRFTVTPSLGMHNRVKMVGCLEDFTIDHLRADVVAVNHRN